MVDSLLANNGNILVGFINGNYNSIQIHFADMTDTYTEASTGYIFWTFTLTVYDVENNITDGVGSVYVDLRFNNDELGEVGNAFLELLFN